LEEVATQIVHFRGRSFLGFLKHEAQVPLPLQFRDHLRQELPPVFLGLEAVLRQRHRRLGTSTRINPIEDLHLGPCFAPASHRAPNIQMLAPDSVSDCLTIYNVRSR
jgi:hypothetical protein